MIWLKPSAIASGNNWPVSRGKSAAVKSGTSFESATVWPICVACHRCVMANCWSVMTVSPRLAFDLRPDEVGTLFLGPANKVAGGDEVRLTGRVASVPVGERLLGRVVDPLGVPLDGNGPLRSDAIWPVEREAPGIADRQPVTEPLLTGTKVIDALLPIGRGQRELILGDRATGKTTIALDAILAQRGTGVKCVYTSIGERKASLAEVVDALAAQGASNTRRSLPPMPTRPRGCNILPRSRPVRSANTSCIRVGTCWSCTTILPSMPMLIAEFAYCSAGRRVEKPIRPTCSTCMLACSSGRPSCTNGSGGGPTALPIAATQAGNVAAYIPTNLISITDGQIYLNTRLFDEGQRPAVEVGLSVSRVGGKAQPPTLRHVVGDLKLLYSQLAELESFTRFGAELEPQRREHLDAAAGCAKRSNNARTSHAGLDNWLRNSSRFGKDCSTHCRFNELMAFSRPLRNA